MTLTCVFYFVTLTNASYWENKETVKIYLSHIRKIQKYYSSFTFISRKKKLRNTFENSKIINNSAKIERTISKTKEKRIKK